MLGKTLNHYKIESRLGKGGMGEVFVAEDTRLSRRVALKVLPQDLASDVERCARFEREAKTIAALNHPNIVTVHSVEQDGDVHFITMELVEGKTLTELIPRNGFHLSKLLDLGVALTDAVSGAHKKGITHRDLKPDNVMLSDEGRLKVLDFGLAKLMEKSPITGQESAVPTQGITAEGKILGTVAYMAPEQAEGKPADARSDIFSLGVMLYQMSTGMRPFQGDTHISTITSILRDTPTSVTELNQGLPRHLGRVIKRCLEKDPERRYQTAQDLRNELQGLQDEIGSGELPVSELPPAVRQGRPRQAWLIAGLGIVAIAAVAVSIFQLAGRGTTVAPAPATPLQTMEISRLTATGDSREATISHDGRYVAYIIDDENEQASMWITQVSTGSRVQIIPPETDIDLFDPIYSPDGEFIYYVRVPPEGPITDLYRIPALGGTPRMVLEDTEGRASFSPDGQRFTFNRFDNPSRKDQLVVADLDGNNQQVLAERAPPDGFNDPVWSPDGTVVVAGVFSSKRIESTLVAVPAEGGKEEPITDSTWLNIFEISWLPDGSGLIVSGTNDFVTTQLWEVTYPGGQTRRVTNDLNSYHGASLTSDGRTMATVMNESSYNLSWLTPGDQTQPVSITSGTKGSDDQGISVAPDGRVVYGSTKGGNLDIRIVDADGTNRTQLTSHPAIDVDPRVSPDGRYIVFLSNRAGTVNIWRMNLDGSHPLRLTEGTLDIDARVSPDGQWVVYRRAEGRDIMRVPMDGGGPVLVSELQLNRFEISPDGTRIAGYNYHEVLQRFVLDVIPFEGGDPITLVDDTRASGFFCWSPDGNSMTLRRRVDGSLNIWRYPLDGSEPVQLTHFGNDSIGGFAWAPDGRLVVAHGHENHDIVLLKNFR